MPVKPLQKPIERPRIDLSNVRTRVFRREEAWRNTVLKKVHRFERPIEFFFETLFFFSRSYFRLFVCAFNTQETGNLLSSILLLHSIFSDRYVSREMMQNEQNQYLPISVIFSTNIDFSFTKLKIKLVVSVLNVLLKYE